MKVLILAAGYATRLYPLTLTQPKPLLPIAGKPMIDHVLDRLATIKGLDRAYVVTNAKFAGHFESWADQYQVSHPKLAITIVNDRSTDDTNKLGAIGDLHFVLERERLADDLIVVAGDNLFSQDLRTFGAYCREMNTPVLGIHDVGDLELVKRYSVVEVDAQNRVGLLYKITQVLSEQELDIHTALINTVADRATDAFYVVDGRGQKIVNYDVLEGIRQQLLERLAS